MKQALLLGSAGFVGRHTFPALVQRGYDVTEIDIKDSMDARKYLAVSRKQFDLIIHAAAIVGGRETIDGQPIKVAADFALDSDVIQFAARTRPGRVVLLSSSAAYPVQLQKRGGITTRLLESDIDLDNIKHPDAIYGLSKIVLEAQAVKLRDLGVAVTVVRPFSGYGADQDTCYPFRAFLERARAHQSPFVIWGDGTQTRDFLHIDDFVEQMLILAETGVDGPVNLCTGVGTSFNELARLMCEAVGYSPRLRHLMEKPVGVHHRVGNPGIVNGIHPATITLDEGIAMALKDKSLR